MGVEGLIWKYSLYIDHRTTWKKKKWKIIITYITHTHTQTDKNTYKIFKVKNNMSSLTNINELADNNNNNTNEDGNNNNNNDNNTS